MAGCAGPLAVPEPTPTGVEVEVCTTLLADLPATVLDRKRRAVTPGHFATAWGDPPISLRCGVPKPPGLTPASECFEVNGIGWYAEQGSTGYLFTTIGRRAFVEVGVPSRYAPEANALVDLAAAVSAHDPVISRCD